MKLNNFRGDLTDISAKKEALLPSCLWPVLYAQAARTAGIVTSVLLTVWPVFF